MGSYIWGITFYGGLSMKLNRKNNCLKLNNVTMYSSEDLPSYQAFLNTVDQEIAATGANIPAPEISIDPPKVPILLRILIDMIF